MSIRIDRRAFEYVEEARARSRVWHGRATDRGKLVSSILHGLQLAGIDLAAPDPEAIAIVLAGAFVRLR